jgi:hypothetical protein
MAEARTLLTNLLLPAPVSPAGSDVWTGRNQTESRR